MTPANRAHSGNQPEPIREQNEDEDGSKEPEGLLHQVRPDDAFQKIIKSLDQPLPKILRSFGNRLHVARRHLRKDNDREGDDPGHEHGIGDGKRTD